MDKIAFFDIDGTIIPKQSQQLLATYLYQKGYLKVHRLIGVTIWFVLYRLHIVSDVNKIMKESYKLLQGWKQADLNKIINNFFSQELVPIISPRILQEINNRRQDNYKIVLISNTIELITDLFKDYLGADFGFGTKLSIDNGVYSGRFEHTPLYGLEKAKLVQYLASKNNWNLSDSVFYSDSYSDLPLFKLVGTPIVINPDKLLKKISIKNKWEQIFC